MTPGASALTVALSSVPLSGIPLNFITVPNSLQVLDSVSDQIKRDFTGWAARGIDIVQWGPGATDDKIDVMVDDLTSSAANELTAAYGNSLIAAKPSPYPSRPEEYSGRYDNSPPWNGGIAINLSHNTSGQPPAHCTTGANATSSTGRKYLITAGHCAAVGDRFYNHNTLLGTVTKRTYVQNGEADAEMIPVPSAAGAAGLIYDGYDLFGGDYTHASLVTAVRTARDAIGDGVCYDGANSGQLCGAEVTKVNQCVEFSSGHVTCDLTQTSRVLPAATGGDSGSPVFTGTGDRTVTIRGQLVGGSGNIDFYCREYWITHYLGVKVIVS